MDQIKIGRFISSCRKAKGLTQMQLAEKLSVTDRAVSKWETGKSMPDSSIMLPLCEELGITVNDLLCGEVVSMDNYKEKAEQSMLEMVKGKEQADKQLLMFEWVIGIISVLFLLGFCFIAKFLEMENWLRAVLIITGFVVGLTGLMFATKIEQSAGYYECRKCRHRYIPTFGSVLWSMHMGRTRYMKCPHCNKHSWQKKRVSASQEND